MALPQRIPPVLEKAIATFNFTDIDEGLGFIHLKGFGTESFSATTLGISKNDIFSDPIETKGVDAVALGGANGVFAIEGTLDFDTSIFNLPRTLKGTAYINGSMAVLRNSGTANPTLYIAFTIYHFDGSTETSLGTVNTTKISDTDGVADIKSFSCEITLTEKHFKKGDKIRVTADFFVSRSAQQVVTVTAVIAHDPQNRNGETLITDASANHTTLNMFIPFRIDL